MSKKLIEQGFQLFLETLDADRRESAENVELDDDAWKGRITISGVDGTTVNGRIVVTDGKNTVKGTFSAKGDKSVK